jgi:hypothetical protein
MKVYLVSYDLDKPGQDYKDLIQALQNLGAVKPLYSEWVLRHPWSSAQIRDYLWQFMDSNDRLLVMEIAGESAWINLMLTNEVFKQAIAA